MSKSIEHAVRAKSDSPADVVFAARCAVQAVVNRLVYELMTGNGDPSRIGSIDLSADERGAVVCRTTLADEGGDYFVENADGKCEKVVPSRATADTTP